MKQKFNVYGMYCSACVSHVEKAINKINGINKVNVSLLSNSMIVEYDETKVNENDIINAVKKVGFNAYEEHTKIVSDDNVKKRKLGLIISLIFMFVLLYIAMGPMIGLPIIKVLEENIVVSGIVQLVLLCPIVIINRFFYVDGYKKLIKRAPNMNTLVAIGSTAAILFGIYIIIYAIINPSEHSNHMELYIESAGTIVTLVSLGKYIEFKSKAKTTEAVNELINLMPKKAIKIINVDGKSIEEEVYVEEIEIGDILLVKNASSIPVDGIIIEGNSEIDESSITGESLLVYKKEGDAVISSTIATIGSFKMRATSTIADSTISRIIEIVEEASNSKAPISRLADKVSSIFVPTVMLISLLSFVIWIIVNKDFAFALKIAISVLVISCPCALGLATPLAIMIATGKGAKHGILFKDAESIEMLYKSNVICFDKTGTITSGELKINEVIALNGDKKNILKIAASLEKNSTHPIAKSIVNEYNSLEYFDIIDFKLVVGRGIEGSIENDKYYIGNIKFINELNIKNRENLDFFNEENTHIILVKNDEIIGLFKLSDHIKKSSFEAVKELKKLGKKVMVLTGDSRLAGEKVSSELGIDKVYSEILPEEKGSIIDDLKREGYIVTMVGDGINDAIALTKSDIGIAIGAGTDVAISSANIVLMKNDLEDVVYASRLSERTIKNIKLSLFWAFFYNALCIPIACGILYPFFEITLNPMIASLAMSLSSISVVINALRLRGK